MKRKRNAFNRGTAVHLGGARVKFVWACDCTRVETMRTPAGYALSDDATAKLVLHWRANGVSLEQCPVHPEYHNRQSQVGRLNESHPQPTLTGD